MPREIGALPFFLVELELQAARSPHFLDELMEVVAGYVLHGVVPAGRHAGQPRRSARCWCGAAGQRPRVAAEGDAALLEYTLRFDRLSLTASDLRIGPDEIEAARRSCPDDLLAAIDLAATRIEAFHRRQVPLGYSYDDDAGNTLGLRWTALAAPAVFARMACNSTSLSG